LYPWQCPTHSHAVLQFSLTVKYGWLVMWSVQSVRAAQLRLCLTQAMVNAQVDAMHCPPAQAEAMPSWCRPVSEARGACSKVWCKRKQYCCAVARCPTATVMMDCRCPRVMRISTPAAMLLYLTHGYGKLAASNWHPAFTIWYAIAMHSRHCCLPVVYDYWLAACSYHSTSCAAQDAKVIRAPTQQHSMAD
jgi:hypothetical protein